MKIACITDTHSGVRNDSAVFQENFKKSLDEFFFPYIDAHKIDTIIHLGDVFDRKKYLNFVTAKHCRESFLEPISNRGIDMHIILGNHDAYYKDTNAVNSLREIIEGRYPFHIYERPVDVSLGGASMLFVPWIPDGAVIRDEFFKSIADSKSTFCFGHLALTGHEEYKGVFAHEGYSPDIFKKFHTVFTGHFHHKSSKGNIEYIGAFTEQRWNDWNDPRGFSVFDTETGEMEFIQNPFNIYHMITYDDVADANIMQSIIQTDYSRYKDCYVKIVSVNKNNPFAFDMLLEKLEKAGVIDLSVIEDISTFIDNEEDTHIDQAEDTATILGKYIDGLTLPIENVKVKAYMQDIFTEAQALEDI